MQPCGSGGGFRLDSTLPGPSSAKSPTDCCSGTSAISRLPRTSTGPGSAKPMPTRLSTRSRPCPTGSAARSRVTSPAIGRPERRRSRKPSAAASRERNTSPRCSTPRRPGAGSCWSRRRCNPATPRSRPRSSARRRRAISSRVHHRRDSAVPHGVHDARRERLRPRRRCRTGRPAIGNQGAVETWL